MTRVTLKPTDICLLRDTREQRPWDLASLGAQVETTTLATGDYSVRGLERDGVAIERKSLEDLVACVGRERPRFEQELFRLLGFRARLVIVEALYCDIEGGGWRGKVTPNAVVGSVMRWQGMGIPFHFAGTPAMAGRYAANFLWLAARAEWDRLRSLKAEIMVGESG